MLRQPVERARPGPALKRGHGAESPQRKLQRARWRDLWPPWAPGAGLALAVAGAYLLAARLGIALHSEGAGAPLLSPAAGVAAGALIALGRRARIPVGIGVLAAATAVNLLVGRPAWAAIAFAFASAGEGLLTAWLVDRWCGRAFRFDDWRGLWGFLAAAALTATGAGLVAAVLMQQLPAPPLLHDAWRMWAAADGLGIILLAPPLVGLYQLAAEPMPRGEALEGTAAIVLFAAAAAAIFTAPPGSPLAHVPPAALCPILLWITARCRPVLATTAVLASSTALIVAATLHGGELGGVHMAAPAVQTIVLIGSLCALSLSALFAERRLSEAALRESNERLQLALGGADLGVWSLDLKTGAFESDERDARINCHDPDDLPRTVAEARAYVHPDDLAGLDAAFSAARRTGGVCRTEYRVRQAGGGPASCSQKRQRIRWVAMEGSVVCDRAGRPERLMGVTRDITERKLAEQALAERTAQLALAGRAGLVGSYAYDIPSGMLQISPGFAAIYGLPEDTAEIAREDWCWRVHPDDMAGFEIRRARAFAASQREMQLEYRIRRPDGEIRWIEQRSLFDYDADGRPRRAVGVNIDMTERKRAEEHKSLLVAELDHRVKNVLAVVSALIARSREGGNSGAPAAELVAALDGRVKAMANAHELLSGSKWHGLPLRALIERELEPHATRSNLEIGGPDVVLSAEAGQALAMVVHELVTNAAKYGALSVARGKVSVRWRLEPENGSGTHLAIDWQESGGPSVTPSARIGYGTCVIRDLIPYELDGKADLAFPPAGVRCHLQVPIRWLTIEAGRPTPAQTEADPLAPISDGGSSVSHGKAPTDTTG